MRFGECRREYPLFIGEEMVVHKSPFNDNWEYTNIDIDSNKELIPCKTLFTPVVLPHDYTMENPFDKQNPSGHQGGYVRTGTLWYRKWFSWDTENANTVLALFEGIYNNSTVYLNGVQVGGRPYGYSSFSVDLSQHIHSGVNLLAVRVDGAKEPSTRWFNGQGITRPVWLLTGPQVHFAVDGVYVRTQFDELQKRALLKVECRVVNLSTRQKSTLKISIKDPYGKVVAEKTIKEHLERGESTFVGKLHIENPSLWSCETPELYSCHTSICGEGCAETDIANVRFGIRTIEFRPNKGFYLNGEHTVLKGVCMHHDGGCVGAAVPKALWKKRIEQLKEMGCNAIRTAHNPFDPAFYDICDQLGMMVLDEAFDGWDINKVEHGYGTLWDEWHETDLKDFIIRDRNHPCVILWSIGNEVLQMNPDITKELMNIIRELDDTRPITAGVQQCSEVSDKNRALLDVAGYNDGGGACFIYERDHEKRPDQLFIATEAPHSFQTRGFYRTQTWWRDKNQPRQEIENLTEEEVFFDQNIHYNSSYDNSGVRTCARDSWAFVEKYPYLCGEFRWTGYDYVGEAFPYTWPSKTHNFGVIDTANFPKDHYYLYQSMWSKKKMLHILPHWTHPGIPAGTQIPVWIYTNVQEVELWLNGRSLGRQRKGGKKELSWLVPYEPGCLTAKAFEESREILTQTVHTAGTPEKLQIENEPMQEEATILSQLSFSIRDANGYFVPNANLVSGIYVSGDVELLGSDNGAIDDMTPFYEKKRRSFNGLGMYLLRYKPDDVQAYAVVASILGDTYFDYATRISLDVQVVSLGGSEHPECEVYYSLNGSEPDSNNGILYTGAFEIAETCRVRMAVFQNHRKLIELADVFFKGRPTPVIDKTHLNHEVDTEYPLGPFSDRICGEWTDGSCTYCFMPTGIITRSLGNLTSTLGHWWYDFPADFLETPDYAGMGEIWLTTGDKMSISLESQVADKLILDNRSNALGNIAVNIPEVVLYRKGR